MPRAGRGTRMDLGLHGHAALITASSGGLGRATAAAFAGAGADVLVNGRDPDRLRDAAADLAGRGPGRVETYRGDITDPAAAAGLVEAAVGAFGRLDHLVTSAGGPPSRWTLETTEADWRDAFELLVMSAVRAVRHAAPHLSGGDGGSIVMVGSGTVTEAKDANVLSNAVRMAIPGLAKTLSRELAPDVRVNVAIPGAIETDRMRERFSSHVQRGTHGSVDDARTARADRIPLGRLGRPRDFGDVVAFLCSDRAAFVTGEVVHVDGGQRRRTL